MIPALVHHAAQSKRCCGWGEGWWWIHLWHHSYGILVGNK